jgi:acetolactate synthase-1/2/3 large subunit
MATVADVVIRELKNAGVSHLFGIPGGSSSTELVEAARRAGLPFVLSHTEEAGAFMAAAQSEILGKPGACLSTLGPGAASAANGVAHGLLDRVSLVILTDQHPLSVRAFAPHQTIDHHAMFAPLTKWTGDLTTAVEADMAYALGIASCLPRGPVHLDCAPDVLTASPTAGASRRLPVTSSFPAGLSEPVLATLRAARHPLVIVGLGALESGDAAAVRALCESRGIPALVTYKAKGVVPDVHPLYAGVFTDGALEAEVLEQADLLLAVGLDPVELLPKAWTHPQRVVYTGRWPLHQQQVPIAGSLIGDLATTLPYLASHLASGAWDPATIVALNTKQRAAMRIPGDSGLAPATVVDRVADRFAGRARVTVDAGAHMFPVMALWPAVQPHEVLISNGLSTMGFALPSAIGAALLDTSQPVVAFTGDGGLLMCLAELKTAARERLPVRVVVFDDGSLSLIRIKQEARGLAPVGVSLGAVDWIKLAEAFGVAAFAARTEAELVTALQHAEAVSGPALIAAKVDGSTYLETIRRLRG